MRSTWGCATAFTTSTCPRSQARTHRPRVCRDAVTPDAERISPGDVQKSLARRALDAQLEAVHAMHAGDGFATLRELRLDCGRQVSAGPVVARAIDREWRRGRRRWQRSPAARTAARRHRRRRSRLVFNRLRTSVFRHLQVVAARRPRQPRQAQQGAYEQEACPSIAALVATKSHSSFHVVGDIWPVQVIPRCA